MSNTWEHVGGNTPAGDAAAHEGMSRAFEASREADRHEVRRAIVWLAEHRPVFTSDDVWDALEGNIEGFEAPSGWMEIKRQALGSIMRSFITSGLIERTGQVQASKRAVRHSGTVAIWRSCVYNPANPSQGVAP